MCNTLMVIHCQPWTDTFSSLLRSKLFPLGPVQCANVRLLRVTGLKPETLSSSPTWAEEVAWKALVQIPFSNNQ